MSMPTPIRTTIHPLLNSKHIAKKTGSWFFICLMSFFASLAFAGQDDPVTFECEYLKMAVEDELGVYDPTEDDMLWLTSITHKECGDEEDIHNAKDCANAITDLSGLEYAYNLTSIDFHLNKIASISPLRYLTKLEDVRLGRNHILDLGGLRNLTRLTYLDIHGNGLSDLSPLAGLTNLQTLLVRWNNIRDLSPLSGLSNLTYLDIHGNGLSEISPLSGLTGLTTLHMHDNEISDISALSGLINLSGLSAYNNQISDVSVLAGLYNLSALYLGRNQISDISPLVALTSLARLHVTRNPLDQQSCDIFAQIMANNSGMIFFNHDPCLSQYGLNISSSAGGSVTTPGEGIFEYDHETSVSVTATAQGNNHFVIWAGTAATAGKIAQLSSPSITIAVDGHYTLEAHFADDQAGDPLVSTLPAKNVTRTSAHLEAYLGNYGEAVCEGWFRYWIKGSQIQTEQSTPRHYGLHKSERYTREVTDLRPGATYYFQAVAENSYGLVAGHILEFITLENVIHVDDNAVSDPAPYDHLISDPHEDGTTDHPYDSVQEAIEHAQDLAKIIVHEGRYYESLNLMGKRLEISSFGPGTSDISSHPVIDTQNEGTVVTFNHGEDPACVLSGLVLTGGFHGAIACMGASPTIRHCLVVGNRSTHARGAIIYCENSHSLFQNVTVYGNAGEGNGAAFGFTDSNALITNSILWNNALSEISVASGHDPVVMYSDVQGSWPGLGNIETDPLFASPSNRTDPENPNFVFLSDDYHLLSEDGRWNPESLTWESDELTSPCIDAGNPDDSALDETFPNGKRVNMGVHGGTAQASLSPRLALAHWSFDETSGDRAFDSLGHNDGTVYGATWTEGKVDGALQFDGEDDYVNLGNDPTLAPDQFTICLWINAQATSDSESVLRKAINYTDNDYRFELFRGRYATFSFGDGTQNVMLRSEAAFPLNEWTHIALTRGDTDATMYINGRPIIDRPHALAPTATGYNLIMGGGFMQPFQGKIDSVHIFDFVLPEGTIAALGNGD